MFANQERIRLGAILLLFVIFVIMAGIGGYIYFIKDRKPTQGVFVYEYDIREEGIEDGYLYSSS